MTEVNEELHPLRAWRESQDLTLRGLAAHLGEWAAGHDTDAAAVSYATLSRIEQRRLNPSFDLLLALLELSQGALALDDWVPAEVRARLEAAQEAGLGHPLRRQAEGRRIVRRGVVT